MSYVCLFRMYSDRVAPSVQSHQQEQCQKCIYVYFEDSSAVWLEFWIANPAHIKQVFIKKKVGVRFNDLVFRLRLWWNVKISKKFWITDASKICSESNKKRECYIALITDDWANISVDRPFFFVKTSRHIALNRCNCHVCVFSGLMHW